MLDVAKFVFKLLLALNLEMQASRVNWVDKLPTLNMIINWKNCSYWLNSSGCCIYIQRETALNCVLCVNGNFAELCFMHYKRTSVQWTDLASPQLHSLRVTRTESLRGTTCYALRATLQNSVLCIFRHKQDKPVCSEQTDDVHCLTGA